MSTKAKSAGTVKVLQVDEIVPYWRNPREIPEEAVQKVASSIERYGYQSMIVVDEGNVIIAGHTRYAALRRLGVREVPVLVSSLDKKRANEYRVIDNRTTEYTTWDEEKLLLELRELSDSAIEDFFPDLDLNSTLDAIQDITDEDVSEAFDGVNADMGMGSEVGVEVICPSCYETFSIPQSRVLALADDIRDRAKQGT